MLRISHARIAQVLTLATFAGLTGRCLAQTCSLVMDFNSASTPRSSEPQSGRAGEPGREAPSGFVEMGGSRYFTALTASHGRELWKTDGTSAGTALVKDIRVGVHSGLGKDESPMLTVVGSRLYFFADDGTHGRELFVSDGTSAGTKLVKDIRAGEASAYTGRPSRLAALGDKLVFAADDGSKGQELWITDGSAAGTVLLKDIATGATGSSPGSFLTIGANVFFVATEATAGTELWVTDGTSAGTRLVVDIRGGNQGSDLSGLTSFRGKVWFAANDGTHGYEIWSSDGTSSGTTLLRDLDTSGDGVTIFGQNIAHANGDVLYFRGMSSSNDAELWKTDGTAAGTVLVKDIRSGTSGSYPFGFVSFGSATFFAADDGANGRELWKTDGTTAGTVLVKDTVNGRSGGATVARSSVFAGKLYFVAGLSPSLDIWETDGTTAGTKIAIVGQGDGAIENLTVIGSRLLHAGSTATVGSELLAYDGTVNAVLKDINPGAATVGSSPTIFGRRDGEAVLVSATDGTGNRKLWRVDRSNVTMLADSVGNNSRSASSASGVIAGKTLTIFVAETDANGAEPWITDGTRAGTRMLKDISGGVASSRPDHFVYMNERFYFAARDAAAGEELWVTDGTESGTQMLLDIRPGTSSSSLSTPVAIDGRLWFRANDGSHGVEPWTSDGTAAGTKLLEDIRTGSSSSSPRDFVAYRGKVVFQANDGTHGSELWASDGTAAGTQLVVDIRTGTASSRPSDLTPFAGELLFSCDDGTHGTELWSTDGTAVGTRLVADFLPGSFGSRPTAFTVVDDVCFAVGTTVGGDSIFVTDGTTDGSRLIRAFGQTEFGAQALTAASNGVYFVKSGAGRELWFVDRSSARLVCDLTPGGSETRPGDVQIADGQLYFTAHSDDYGEEVFRIALPGASCEILGAGSAPGYPRLGCSSNPVLGGFARFDYANGPAGHIGLAFLSAPRAPQSVTGLTAKGAYLRVDLASMILLVPTATREGAFALPIPSDTSFVGARANTQMLWVPAVTVLPLQVSNGVRLNVGS